MAIRRNQVPSLAISRQSVAINVNQCPCGWCCYQPGIPALAPSQTATAAAVRRLRSVAMERSPVRSPRLLAAGGLCDLALLYRSRGYEDDAKFVDELAQVQTESGQIWVLAASVPRVLELAQKGREEGGEAQREKRRAQRARLLFVHGPRRCASATRTVGYVRECRNESTSCSQEAEGDESRVVLVSFTCYSWCAVLLRRYTIYYDRTSSYVFY